MARKPRNQAPEEGTRLDDDQLASAVRESAQQIWQAGLGAFAKAQQEGARAFSKLVKDGSELQKRARKVEEATDTVARAAERASRRGTGSWGKLEQVFQERVARALDTIGAPDRTEVEELKHRVGELERMVAQLADQLHARPAAPRAGAKRGPAAAAAKPAAKPAARKVPAKKTVGKPPRGGAGD